MTVSKQSVYLQPGESKSVSFAFTLTQVKTYQVNCDGLTGQVTVLAPPAAEFVISNLVIDPPEVYVGETVNIWVTVTNVGTAAGSTEVTCEVI